MKENNNYSELSSTLDFSKTGDGLLPAIIQDAGSGKLLMLGYMNAEALEKTIETKLATFYSRSKKRLWVKGETSQNYLHVISIKSDCDNDTLLIKANPDGPVCHTGADTCFGEKNEKGGLEFLEELEVVIKGRNAERKSGSYTSSLFEKGINAVVQKVGEEAIELVIEAKDDNKDLFLNEAADLLFHYLILLEAKNTKITDVLHILKERRK